MTAQMNAPRAISTAAGVSLILLTFVMVASGDKRPSDLRKGMLLLSQSRWPEALSFFSSVAASEPTTPGLFCHAAFELLSADQVGRRAPPASGPL